MDAGDFHGGGVADREEGDQAEVVEDVADAVGEPAFGAGGHFLVAVDDGHVAGEVGDIGARVTKVQPSSRNPSPMPRATAKAPLPQR